MPQLLRHGSNLLQEHRTRNDAWKSCFQETLDAHISRIPLCVARIFASGETANSEERNAAERCCCQHCADQFIASGKLDSSRVCMNCERSGCHLCITQSSDGSNQCNSQVCELVSRLRSGACNIRKFCFESDRLARKLMHQWLVLQFKQERQLGSLRAYFLVQSRTAALFCGQANALANALQMCETVREQANPDKNARARLI